MPSSNVFLVPCDPGNFETTVKSAVDLTEYPDRPEPLQGLDEGRFWGARSGDGNRAYFKKMTPGDLVLFYQNGNYIAVGKIGTTFEDTDGWVRAKFWKNAPSQLIYTIDEYESVLVPRAKVNTIFDYNDEYYPQGLMRVADSRVTNRVDAIKRAIEMTSTN